MLVSNLSCSLFLILPAFDSNWTEELIRLFKMTDAVLVRFRGTDLILSRWKNSGLVHHHDLFVRAFSKSY